MILFMGFKKIMHIIFFFPIGKYLKKDFFLNAKNILCVECIFATFQIVGFLFVNRRVESGVTSFKRPG